MADLSPPGPDSPDVEFKEWVSDVMDNRLASERLAAFEAICVVWDAAVGGFYPRQDELRELLVDLQQNLGIEEKTWLASVRAVRG